LKLERFITPEYLISQKLLHAAPKGYGGRGDKWASAVLSLVKDHDCKTILDYGCGQGTLKVAIQSHLPKDAVTEYDPAIQGKDEIEKYKTFDLVVCTDVLEHIEPDRLAVVIDHLFRLTNKVLFLVIATRPSNKFFPDGRNVHLTIEPAGWWRDRINHPVFVEVEAPKSPMDQKSRELVAVFVRR
jgi:hypothetical protein